METMSDILVVDDEPGVCRSCRDILARDGWRVETALTGRECIDRTRSKSFAVIVLDLRIPDVGGIKLLEEIRRLHPETSVIIITGYSSVASAVEAMKVGACDYIAKPFTPEQICNAVDRAARSFETAMHREHGATINAEDVLKALNRATREAGFASKIIEQDSEALTGYNLSSEARAALLSGDVRWIERHAGNLTDMQRAWLDRRLQQERW